MSELDKALVEAQKIAKSVGKDKSNSFHRYKYASAEAMIEEARGALTEAGLAFRCVGAIASTPDGKPPMLLVCYKLSHISGEHEIIESETPIIEEKGRPFDKAVATAKTYDLGYTLRGLLLLPRVEEEVDERDDRRYEPKANNVVPIKKEEPQEMPMEELLQLTLDIGNAKSDQELDVLAKRVASAFAEGTITKDQRAEANRLGKITREKIAKLAKAGA